jgi:hypothetical protein
MVSVRDPGHIVNLIKGAIAADLQKRVSIVSLDAPQP